MQLFNKKERLVEQRTYGFVEGMAGIGYEKETKATFAGEKVSSTQTSLSGGAGIMLKVRSETKCEINHDKMFIEPSFELRIGFDLNFKFEVFWPLITETVKVNK